MKSRILLTCLLSLPYVQAADIPADQLEFFEAKIRPVLAESCYECHNSIDKKKGKFALDWKDALLAGGSEGEAIIPGNTKDSLLIQSIKHLDDLEMPSKAPKLSDEVIADFEKWIKMGAPDPRTKKPTAEDLKNSKVKWETVRDRRVKWWSFQPLKYTSPAKPAAKDWQQNGIDAYVYAGLEKQQLAPSPVADKYTLIRRLSLVLTGLPPTEQEITDFVNSTDAGAYEKQVDQYLASKAFGEKWARHWMDWYRFAESHGSEGDPAIPHTGVYRDYLIRAFNDDVPYNQLLKEHIAGDLLKNPRIDKELELNESAIGPAHFRMVPHGFGVTDAYDEQVTFTDNQVDVISKAMLGLTVSCARCHNHKFDPISQKDFFRFYGIMVGNKASTVVVDSEEKLETNKKEIAALKNEIRKEFAALWMSQVQDLPNQLKTNPNVHATMPEQLPRLKKGQKLSREDQKNRRQKEEKIRAAREAIGKMNKKEHPLNLWKNRQSKALPELIKQHQDQIARVRKDNEAARNEASYYIDLRDPKNTSKWFATGNGSHHIVSPAGSFALAIGGDKAIRGIYAAGIYSHLISDKHAAVFSSSDFWIKGKGGKVRLAGQGAQARMAVRNYPLAHGGLHPTFPPKNTRLSWVDINRKWNYWKGDKAHVEMRTSMEVIPRGNGERSWWGIAEIMVGDKFLQDESASLANVIDLAKVKDEASMNKAYMSALKQVITNWRNENMTDAEAEFLNVFVDFGILKNKTQDLPVSLQTKINKFRDLEKAIPTPTRAPGLIESEPVDQKLMVRGDYKKEADPVKRQFLEIFSHKTYSTGSGRLELAEDMVSQTNTLKSRLLVNRLWAYIYGQGIVKSTDNFGRLGSKPTHPDLLDYLALNFEKNGWSMKKAIRQMVTARTFMSRSQADKATLTKDPENLYLSFFTPRRMDAEMLHDSLKAIAGRRDKRAVYDRVIRNRLNPLLTAFNRPTPVSTVSTRLTTNVPAQALTMMNKLAIELAKSTTDKVLRNKTLKTDEDKINALFMIIYQRPAADGEIKVCLKFLNASGHDLNRLSETLLNSKEVIYVH